MLTIFACRMIYQSVRGWLAQRSTNESLWFAANIGFMTVLLSQSML
jgi:hypothetical protein